MIIRINNVTIDAGELDANASIDTIKQALTFAHPEVANATPRETKNADGERVIEFMPVAGKKG